MVMILILQSLLWGVLNMKIKNYKLRASINIALIIAGVFIIYMAKGAPCFTQKQNFDYILKRNLAQKAEIIYTVKPENSEWSKADERLYILRYDNQIGVLRTMKTYVKGTAYITRNSIIKPVVVEDGIAIIPLYASMDWTNEKYIGVCAVVALDKRIKSTELSYNEDFEKPKKVISNQSKNSVFVLKIDISEEYKDYLIYPHAFDIYNDICINYFSAKGFDENGNLISEIIGAAERSKHEN